MKADPAWRDPIHQATAFGGGVLTNDNSERKFIYAYWSELDYYAHREGPYGKVSKKNFLRLDNQIELISKSLKGTDTIIVATADHGFIERKDEKKLIMLNDYPKIYETLECPLSGDTRTVYCYVKHPMRKQFEEYVKKDLRNICVLRKSKDLIKENYFGLFGKNKNLAGRIGDYTLLLKNNYIMKDRVSGEKMNIYIGNHGGMSKEEMFVPLIVIEL